MTSRETGRDMAAPRASPKGDRKGPWLSAVMLTLALTLVLLGFLLDRRKADADWSRRYFETLGRSPQSAWASTMDPSAYLLRKRKFAAWRLTHPTDPPPDDIDSFDESSIAAVLPKGALDSPPDLEYLSTVEGQAAAREIREAARRHRELSAERARRYWGIVGPNLRPVIGDLENRALELVIRLSVRSGHAPKPEVDFSYRRLSTDWVSFQVPSGWKEVEPRQTERLRGLLQDEQLMVQSGLGVLSPVGEVEEFTAVTQPDGEAILSAALMTDMPECQDYVQQRQRIREGAGRALAMGAISKYHGDTLLQLDGHTALRVDIETSSWRVITFQIRLRDSSARAIFVSEVCEPSKYVALTSVFSHVANTIRVVERVTGQGSGQGGIPNRSPSSP